VSAPPARAEIRPLAPARYSFHVTISAETRDKLRRAQDLLQHTRPGADPAAVLDRALTLLLEHLERQKFAALTTKATRSATSAARRVRKSRAVAPATRGSGAADEPPPDRAAGSTPARNATSGAGVRPLTTPRRKRAGARYIPAAVRRAVWAREAGRCGFVTPDGVRCTATGRLEFHHRVPLAEGGAATVENLSLRCTHHNGCEARRWFGDEAVDQARRNRERPVERGRVAGNFAWTELASRTESPQRP
jgi:5-methylcytosine-specific restriction endonuclease McrA